MSLLSTPTGRPERVYSLLSLVRTLDGRVSSSEAKEWLAPDYRSTETPAPRDASKDGERVSEAFRVARDLGLLAADKKDWVSTCTLPATPRAFARHVHTYLCGLPPEDPDAVLMRAYGWCIAYCEGNGAFGLVSLPASTLAREIAAGLGRSNEGEDEKSFNTTKLSAWKDWMAFLGLGWLDLPGVGGFLPDPTRRLEEELHVLLPAEGRVEARIFLGSVAQRLPYLDGGIISEAAFTTGLQRPPTGRTSRVLSQALRSLEGMGTVHLDMDGDAKKGVQLYPDPLSKVNAFSHIGVGHV